MSFISFFDPDDSGMMAEELVSTEAGGKGGLEFVGTVVWDDVEDDNDDTDTPRCKIRVAVAREPGDLNAERSYVTEGDELVEGRDTVVEVDDRLTQVPLVS